MTVYKVTIQTLSPLHIGDGNTLHQNFDFVTKEGKTWRLNEDEILRAFEARVLPGSDGRYPTPGALVMQDASNFGNPTFFRYSLPGVARSGKTYAELKSFIKDVYDRPYIPGSSLKGALRTALAWTGWSDVNLHLNGRGDVGNNKSWAAQPLERKLFGRDPNHDLLRALHVSDLCGPQTPGGALRVVNAQVLTMKKAQSPIELETLPGSVDFSGTLTVDETLFTPWAERELGFNNRRHWLNEITLRAQRHSLARIAELMEWFEKAQGAEKIAGFYRKLSEAQILPNQALLQIGWGTGWDGKTYWTHLQKSPALFEQLISEFRMHKASKDSPARKIGDAFPRSKRAAMVIKQDIAAAVAPFGWVLLTLEPIGEAPAHWKTMMQKPPEKTPLIISSPVHPIQPANPPSVTPSTAAPKPIIVDPKPAATLPPVISDFSKEHMPKPGERFMGEAFDGTGLKLLLSIPGLDPDNDAYALVTPAENHSGDKMRNGLKVLCEVLRLEQEKKGYWCIHCCSIETR